MNDHSPQASPWVVSTSAATFSRDVLEASHDRMIVVDFWAAWCQPCRMLAPLLEQLAEEYDGRFQLVKADTEELPEAAAQFQVQSIPAVFAVMGGEVVDFFQGLLPEGQIRSWLDNLLDQREVETARRLEDTDPEGAIQRYRALIEQAPKEAAPQIGLARTLQQQGQNDEAMAIVERLEKRGFLEPEAEKVKSALLVSGGGTSDGADLAALQRSAEQSPDDLDLQLQLARALAAADQREEALQVCLTLVEKDRAGVGEDARRLMIDIFNVLPDGSELTTTYRRRLSTLLY